jgi:hypothetical protein
MGITSTNNITYRCGTVKYQPPFAQKRQLNTLKSARIAVQGKARLERLFHSGAEQRRHAP